MDAHEIITALEAPTEDRRPLMATLGDDTPTSALADALASAREPRTRQLLADLLGRRACPDGIGALTAALEDPDPRVRASAADALGKIFLMRPDADGRETTGAALLARWAVESEVAVRHMLAAALGATLYTPAVTALQTATGDPDPGVRAAAGWALARFPAAERDTA